MVCVRAVSAAWLLLLALLLRGAAGRAAAGEGVGVGGGGGGAVAAPWAPHNPMVDDEGDIFAESVPAAPVAEAPSSPQPAAASTPPSASGRRHIGRSRSVRQEKQGVLPKFLTPHHVFKPTTQSPELLKPLTLSSMLKKFKFKGYGLSFAKSLTSWSQLGLGVRIPITPNFPDYDSHTMLPRIGALSGLWWELDTGFFLRSSVSLSFPLKGTLIFAAVLASLVGFVPDALAARIRNRKATDSIRRVGFTISLRYVPSGPKKGLCIALGPWFFYVPGLKVMSRVLPFVFFLPAVLVALVNLAVEMDAASSRFVPAAVDLGLTDGMWGAWPLSALVGARLGVAPPAAPAVAVAAGLQRSSEPTQTVAPTSTSPSQQAALFVSSNQQQQQQQQGQKQPLDGSAAADPPSTASARRSQGVRYWHAAWLQWCGTKTAGLGLNTGENLSLNFKSAPPRSGKAGSADPYSYGHGSGSGSVSQFDASATMGSSVLFDIAPFFPFGPGVALPEVEQIKLFWRRWWALAVEGAGEYWRAMWATPQKGARGAAAKRRENEDEEEEEVGTKTASDHEVDEGEENGKEPGPVTVRDETAQTGEDAKTVRGRGRRTAKTKKTTKVVEAAAA